MLIMLSAESVGCCAERRVLCHSLCLLGVLKSATFAIKKLYFAETLQLQLHINLTTLFLGYFPLELQEWDPT